MMKTGSPRIRRIPVVVSAVLLTVYGLVGLFGGTGAFTDALYWHDYTIPEVRPGGAVEEAGFLPGDSVVSVEGIPVVELGMYSRWPRSLDRSPGETLTMTVERNGELVRGEIRFRERPAAVAKMQLEGWLVLLSFLWVGVWAYLTIPSAHASRLAAMGFALAVASPGPNFGSWNGVRDHIQLAGMVLWTLLLLRFFLSFPKPKRLARGHLTTVVLYVPWVILLGCLATELLYHPRFYHAFGGFSSLLMLGYALLAVGALLHTWVSSSRVELRESGMAPVLVAVGLAAVGVGVWFADAAFLQSVEIPLSGWSPLLLMALPVGMALGVRQKATSG